MAKYPVYDSDIFTLYPPPSALNITSEAGETVPSEPIRWLESPTALNVYTCILNAYLASFQVSDPKRFTILIVIILIKYYNDLFVKKLTSNYN